MKDGDPTTPSDALFPKLVRDLARIEDLRTAAEDGDPEAKREFWELAGAMQVKLAIHRGTMDPNQPREG